MFSRSSQIIYNNKEDSNRKIKVVLEETDGDGVEYENDVGDNDYSAESQAQVEEDDKDNLFKQSAAVARGAKGVVNETTDIDASDFSADMTVPSEIPQD